MFWKIVKVLLVLGVIAFLMLVIGPCVYYNYIDKGDTAQVSMPDVEKAPNSFYIENTGGLILSSDYEQHGQTAGSRLFILHGYWEMRGNKFKHNDGTITLDENIFGKITVETRTK